MNKINTSRFHIGQKVKLKKCYKKFPKGHIVTVLDNVKKGKNYSNKVEDAFGNQEDVPIKYLEEI